MTLPVVNLIGVSRPKFLMLPLVCVAVSAGAAVYEGFSIDSLRLSLVLLAALAAHVAVNALNEYADYKSGLDFHTQRTPFSGGSGTLVAYPKLAPAARALGWLAAGISGTLGLWLVVIAGPGLLPLGVLGLVLVATYSGPASRHRLWVLIAPGLGFGLVMVVGTYVALTGNVSRLTIAAAALMFFLANNLLLLNQFPDRQADAAVQRDNYVIRNPRLAARLYALFLVGAALAVFEVARTEPWALIALVPMSLGVHGWYGAYRFGDTGQLQHSALAANVAAALVTPAVLGMVLGVRFLLQV